MDYIFIILVAVCTISFILYFFSKRQQSITQPQPTPQPIQQQPKFLPTNPIIQKVEEERKKFQEQKLKDVANPNYQQDYKQAYQKLIQNIHKTQTENVEKDKILLAKLNPQPKEFHETVDKLGKEADNMFYANPDGTRGAKNKIDEKLDKQLFWSKQRKLISIGMIISSIGLLIMLGS